MFDANSRAELDEALGYERFVLKSCADSIRQSHGVSGPISLIIPDEVPNQIGVMLADTFGDTGAGMTLKMSPLIFSAAYKLLDMAIEWIIHENGIACPFQFSKKIAIIDTTPNLAYPDFIQSDPAMRDVLVGLFKEALPYRNAITHNKWGENIDGDLHFGFHGRNGQHYSTVVRCETTLALHRRTGRRIPDAPVTGRLGPVPALPQRANTLATIHEGRRVAIPCRSGRDAARGMVQPDEWRLPGRS